MKLSSDKTIKSFLEKLLSEGKSPISIKNYKSDIRHFLAWISLKLQSIGAYAENLIDALPFLSGSLAAEYKEFMLQNKVKVGTINRRLSSLRSLSKFLVASHNLDSDFMEGIQNARTDKYKPVQVKNEDIVDSFRKSLAEAKDISHNTVKNYVSDVRSFLSWFEREGELPRGI